MGSVGPADSVMLADLGPLVPFEERITANLYPVMKHFSPDP